MKPTEPDFPLLQQASPAMGPVDGTDKLTLTPRTGARVQRAAFSLSALEVSGAAQLGVRDHTSQDGTAWAGGGCSARSSHPAEQTSNRAGFCFSLLADGLKLDPSALPSMDNGINQLMDKMRGALCDTQGCARPAPSYPENISFAQADVK